MMSVSNEKSKYKKRTEIGLKTAAKAVAKVPDGTHRAAMVRALAAAGPRSHMDLRSLTKK